MPARTAARLWPPASGPRPRRRLVVLAALLAISHVLLAPPAPVADGPRPPRPPVELTSRWTVPAPHVDARFATMPTVGPQGQPGLWRLTDRSLPLRFTVEQRVVDRFGLDVIESAVESWNDIPGSRFAAHVDRVKDSGITTRRRDGVHRIFLDTRTCGHRYLARAHLWRGPLTVQDGRAIQTIAEVDIGLCDRLRAEQLVPVMRHELAHAAGLDHLCDLSEPCHRPGMDDDNTCRIMSPRAHPCQAATEADHAGFAHLYPSLPRAGGADGRSTAAAVARALSPSPWSSRTAVAAPYDAELDLQLAAAGLAAAAGTPLLLVDDDCTSGPDGAALHRTVTVAGSVVLVGEVADGCARTLEDVWALRVERIPDADAARRRVLDEVGLPLRLVLAPEPGAGRAVPVAATALPAAVRMDTVVVLNRPDRSVDHVRALLDAYPSIREVLVVGDADLVSTREAAEIAAEGVTVRRVPGATAVETSVALLQIGEFVGPGALSAVLVGADQAQHAVPAATLAAATGAVLMPVEAEPRPLLEQLLRERVDRAAIVGGPQGIGPEQQYRLGRLIAGH